MGMTTWLPMSCKWEPCKTMGGLLLFSFFKELFWDIKHMPHINGIIQYVGFFGDWFLSFNIMFSRFVYVSAWISTLLLFTAEYVSGTSHLLTPTSGVAGMWMWTWGWKICLDNKLRVCWDRWSNRLEGAWTIWWTQHWSCHCFSPLEWRTVSS